jgi:hypothetical protein
MLQNVYNGAEDQGLAHRPPKAVRRLINTGFAGVHTNVLTMKTVLIGLNLDWFDDEKFFGVVTAGAQRRQVAAATK